jgi:hypothetical protein
MSDPLIAFSALAEHMTKVALWEKNFQYWNK